MLSNDKLILLTNDDGIDSPGLRAAAEVLSTLAQVIVVAPVEQWSGAGRSMPATTGGVIYVQQQQINGNHWEVYAVEGTPAQAVQHGVLELAPRLPDLVVAGINYGENVGTGVTISGTIGAALEAASFGLPALAISLETPIAYHHSHSEEIQFAAAAYFTRLFAQLLLSLPRPPDVDVLKVEIPADATPATPWQLAYQSRQRYFAPVKPRRKTFAERARVEYSREIAAQREPGSDVEVLIHDKMIAVTPLSLDLTSRIDLRAWENTLKTGLR